MAEQPHQKYDITIKDLFAGNEEALNRYSGGINIREVQPLDVEFNRLEARAPDLIVRLMLADPVTPKSIYWHRSLPFRPKVVPNSQYIIGPIQSA